MTKFYAHHNSPPSYANSAYFGIHTFKSIDTDGKATLVRWRFVPEDGEKGLTDAELTSMPRDFLEQALIDRVKQGPVKWDMSVCRIGAADRDSIAFRGSSASATLRRRQRSRCQ
jgi:catalase